MHGVVESLILKYADFILMGIATSLASIVTASLTGFENSFCVFFLLLGVYIVGVSAKIF